MPYIKINQDSTVTLAGMIASPEMVQEGYFMYDNEIPQCSYGLGQVLVYENNTVVAKVKDIKVLEGIVKKAIQDVLDAKAKAKGYDDIVSACSYASVENVFCEESKKFVVWRASVWHYAYEQLTLINAEQRDIPTLEAFLNELPSIEI